MRAIFASLIATALFILGCAKFPPNSSSTLRPEVFCEGESVAVTFDTLVGAVRLSWSPVASWHNVYRSDVSASAAAEKLTATPTTDSSFYDFTVKPGKSYEYRLTMSNPDGITETLKSVPYRISLSAELFSYYGDDCSDNDSDSFDTDADGHLDRMIWIDWDQDGRIDINDQGGPDVHIGDEASMFPNGKDPQKPYFGLDTTHYSLVDMYPFVDTCNFILLPDGSRHVFRSVVTKFIPPPTSTVRDTIDKPAFHRYIYRGPYTYEFIFGDWGIDEEIMDGRDNDQDGLTDEDSRGIDDTLDNDGDRFPAGGDREKMPAMVWNDENSNFQIDWPCSDTVRVLKKGKYLVLARFIQVKNAALGLFDPQRDTTALADTTILMHRCAPGGEFVSGTSGEDEERYDGIDNDGDGLVDEDLAKPSAIPMESVRNALIARLNTDHDKLGVYWQKIRDTISELSKGF